MRIIGNGMRTDHPIRGLPFIDDGHIPVEDGDAVDSVGRHEGTDMWRRVDRARVWPPREAFGNPEAGDGGWKAFTTDPLRHDLGWVVRWHPILGRSVWLVSDSDASGLYSVLEDEMILLRAGGYWLGQDSQWYRPPQIFDYASGRYVERAVPNAVAMTAASRLARQGGDQVAEPVSLTVHDIDLDNPPHLPGPVWEAHFQAWADCRAADALPLDRCVIDVSAPELAASELLGAPDMARIAGIAPGTLRGYRSRGENDIPAPQAVDAGRPKWSRPVIDQWIEARSYTPEAAEEAVSAAPVEGADLVQWPMGLLDIRNRFHGWFLSCLAGGHGRGRRARAARVDAQEIADALSWTVARNLEGLLPAEPMTHVLTAAIMREVEDAATNDLPLVLDRLTGKMLDWMIRTLPFWARVAVQEVIEETERKHYTVTRSDIADAIRCSISMDGASRDGQTILDPDRLDKWLRGVFPADFNTGLPDA